MSDNTETGLVVVEDKQVDRKESQMEKSGFLACQMTVMMTDKNSTMLTPIKN